MHREVSTSKNMSTSWQHTACSPSTKIILHLIIKVHYRDEILKFCFDTFDVDGSGTIDEKEFIRLCDFVNNGSPIFPGNFKTYETSLNFRLSKHHRALLQFDVNEDGVIDYQEFIKIYKRFPLVLFPAFRLQDAMQKNSLGERTWIRIIEEYHRAQQREAYRKLHNGKDPPVSCFARIFGGKPSGTNDLGILGTGAAMQRRHSLQAAHGIPS